MSTRILLIEDDLILRSTIKDLLVFSDFDVVEAGCVSDALLKINDKSLDLILCDVTLPDLDGYDFLDFVRKNETSFDIPFIFLSAKVSDDDIRYAMNKGADDYLKKPFTSKILLDTIASRLQLKSKSVAYSNKKLLSIVDNHFNEDFLKTLSNIYNGAFTISTATEIMTNQDFGEAIGEIYSSSFRLYRNTKNLIMFAHFSKNDRLPDIGVDNAPLFISDTVSQLVEYYNKASSLPDILADIDFVPFPIELRGKLNSEHLQFIFSELIDNALSHVHSDSPPVIKLLGFEDGFAFKIINTVSKGVEFSMEEIEPFKKFGHDSKRAGLGLGLYNCKRLCSALGFNLSFNFEGGYLQVDFTVPYRSITTVDSLNENRKELYITA